MMNDKNKKGYYNSKKLVKEQEKKHQIDLEHAKARLFKKLEQRQNSKMTEQDQDRIAGLLIKHLQNTLTPDENEELQNCLESNKAAKYCFDTVSDPEKLLTHLMKKMENKEKTS